ncbi:MAG TPA: hypothetical protein VGL22_12715 [Terracidiphilus sp.]|jgi:hypothetical protein
MKNKLAIAFFALLLLLGFVSWNVWYAVYEPVTPTPSLVELGRQQLHNQLQQSVSRETEIEKQDWDSVTLLRSLIEAHQHRIDQLKDNSQAGEILAHDRVAIARIEKRIADLKAQQAQQAQQADSSAVESDQTSPNPPANSRPAPPTAKPARKAQSPASPKPAPSPPQTH